MDKHRLAIVSGLAFAAGLYVLARRWAHPDQLSDLTQIWVAARAWLQGRDPYQAVQAWGAWPFPLLYPFPAVLVIVPLALTPTWVADALFVGSGTALLAHGLTREEWKAPGLLVFASAPFLHAITLSQWSPLLSGAALSPWAGFLLVCKPTIGLALFAAFPRWIAAAGAALLTLVSLLLWPGWIFEWRTALAGAPNAVAPVTLFGGPLLLLALVKWRRPEARLLAALACIPHTTLAYEAVPLFLVPATWSESWILWGGTVLALLGHGWTGPYASQMAWVRASGVWLVWCAYLPCLAIVLRRPNAAPEGFTYNPGRLPCRDVSKA